MNQKGVTLMETLVALGILVTGVFAGVSLMISTLTFSQSNEQTITVANLAREGLEIVRSIRENDPDYFFSSLADGDYVIDSYTWDDLTHLADSANIANCSNCLLNLNNNRYLHTSGNATIFKRMVSIDTDSTNSWDKKIVSRVYWSEHGKSHTFILESHLTDWRTTE